MKHSLNVPLKYHKFLKYFALPFNILSILGDMGNILGQLNEDSYYYRLSEEVETLLELGLVYDVVALILVIITLVGFYAERPYGYMGFHISLILARVWDLSMIFFYLDIMPEQVASPIGSFIGGMIYTILVLKYYQKRRFIFYDEEPPACWTIPETPAPTANSTTASAPYIPPAPSTTPAIKEHTAVCFCRKCGAMLLESSRFCAKCGTEIIEVE